MSAKYILYIDDTGSRNPDKQSSPGRQDKMDCFGLGGFLLKEEDISNLRSKYAAFCSDWGIDYPLHSSSIRGGRGKFSWLRQSPENKDKFLSALEDLLISLPLLGIACVVHRPGYVARYREVYRDSLWFMCKTAFTILVERSAKYADANGRRLEIVFEESGKNEDRNIIQYLKELKLSGNPFSQNTSEGYTPLAAADFQRIILGEPQRHTKKLPMLQVADLVLYPIAKGGYEKTYHPYLRFLEKGKLIDCVLSDDLKPLQGIKYSCFNS